MPRRKPTRKPGLFEPVYVMVGAAEVTTTALRELGSDKDTSDAAADDRSVLARLRGDVVDIARGTTRVPGRAVEEMLTRYADLAERGQKTVAGAIPVMTRARREGEGALKAEEAKARREARRLARQAGATVDRGRTMATQAATDAQKTAQKTAERTIDAVRTEAEHVVDAVTRPGHIKRRPVRDSSTRRRSAVTDTAVTATSPIGGDPDAKAELAGSGGVEAAAATIRNRPSRTRKSVPAGEDVTPRRTSVRRNAAAQAAASSPDPTTVVAKKARERAAGPDEGSEKVWTSETPSPAKEGAEHQGRHEHDVPTPGDVAKIVETSHHDG